MELSQKMSRNKSGEKVAKEDNAASFIKVSD